MKARDLLEDFMYMARDDPRIGPCHISLYVAVLHFFQKQGEINPIYVYSSELRKQSKIISERTYYSCMRDLKQCGYIKLEPSFNAAKASALFLQRL